MVKFLDLVRCPYCESKIRHIKSYGKERKFGVVKCDCDEYPYFDKVLILIKDDFQLNKRIIKILQRHNIYAIIWACLSGNRFLIRLVIIIFYFLNRQFGFKLTEEKLYYLLKILVSNKSWFEYLRQRENAMDFIMAVNRFQKNKPGDLLTDIGCGTGQFIRKISHFKEVANSIIGIDKSILSILIANLYVHKKNILFVLTDLEQGIPLHNSVSDSTIMLNSLPWIYNKSVYLKEIARVLKRNSRLFIFNIFSPIGKAKSWGDGVFTNKLKLLLKEKFKEIRLVNYPHKSNLKIDDYGYNAFAVKK